MPETLDYALPARRESPRAARLLPVWIISFVATLLLTMGVWSRQNTGWVSPGQFDIDVTQTAWGLPHWLIVNRVRSTGMPPPMSSPSLPMAGAFQPGGHVDVGALCLSVAGCLVVSLLTCGFVWFLRWAHPSARPLDKTFWYTLGGTAAITGIGGWIALRASGAAAALFALVGLPLIVIVATAIRRTYAGGVLFAVVVTLFFWWGSRMALLSTRASGRFDADDLPVITVILPVLLILALGTAFFRRRRVASAPAA